VNNQAFHFEIKDVITQFIAAFDDCVIKRFNNDRSTADQIEVRYVYAPKQRVIYDIVNKAKNITLPVVSVSINRVQRDPSRVFNKIEGFYYPTTLEQKSTEFSSKIDTPVPINISVNLSILAKYQTDIEQIISNFGAYTNPYIIIVWKIPSAFNLTETYEIRSEVDWSGSIDLRYPEELNANDNYRVSGDTSFTIKGWLFPEAPQSNTKNIFFIDANFYATRTLSGAPYNRLYTTYDDYATLSALDLPGFTESIYISATPQITDVFFANTTGIGKPILNDILLTSTDIGSVITLAGKNFQYTTTVALCSNNSDSFYGQLTALDFTYYDTISCYILSSYNYVNENYMTINVPNLTASGDFNIVVINEAGYSTTLDAYNTHFTFSA